MAAIMNFTVDNNLPFSTIQQPSFANMLSVVARRQIEVPKTKIFMNYLKESFEKMKMKLIDVLSKQPFLCITCDVWSSRAQSYLGMTVHFINEKYGRESYILAFRPLKKKQTYAVLTNEIVKVLADYNIVVDKITNIVTDGGSSFCKAPKVYGRGADPLVEPNQPNLLIEDEENESNNSLPFMQDENGQQFIGNTDIFERNIIIIIITSIA